MEWIRDTSNRFRNLLESRAPKDVEWCDMYGEKTTLLEHYRDVCGWLNWGHGDDEDWKINAEEICEDMEDFFVEFGLRPINVRVGDITSGGAVMPMYRTMEATRSFNAEWQFLFVFGKTERREQQ